MPLIEMARYRRRADAEHDMAKATSDATVAAIHEWLAQKYDRLADRCGDDAELNDAPLPFPSVQGRESGK